MTDSHPISRRTAFAGLGAGGPGLVLASTSGNAGAQNASLQTADAHPIVGTWILQFEPGPGVPVTPAVTVFGADGSFIDAANGHAGVWEETGEGTVLHTWVHVFPQANNYVAVSGTIQLDPSGASWTQDYSSVVVSAEGAVLNSGGGRVSAARLTAVPEDQMGAPLEIVPVWTPMTATPT